MRYAHPRGTERTCSVHAANGDPAWFPAEELVLVPHPRPGVHQRIRVCAECLALLRDRHPGRYE